MGASRAQSFLDVTMLKLSNSPDSSMQLLNLPPNRLTPMMLKISQKTRQTSRTLKIAGIAWISAFTTTCTQATSNKMPAMHCVRKKGATIRQSKLCQMPTDFHSDFTRMLISEFVIK